VLSIESNREFGGGWSTKEKHIETIKNRIGRSMEDHGEPSDQSQKINGQPVNDHWTIIE
jgi:hypothetical protein